MSVIPMSVSEEDVDDGVELELEDSSLSIDRPFDPEKIKVRTVPVVVDQIVKRIEFGEIDLAPDFQRLRGVWDARRKSRLIESLLLRIPLPVFYVAADQKENWAVVDGLQRMSTIYEFTKGEFVLADLEYLAQLSGMRFDVLPRPMQRRIDETQLIVNVIEPGTPDEVMFNIFSRINTGGLKLNGQEIRHAMNKGPARAFLRELADSPEFLRATDYSVRKLRMADRECVLRFLAFFMNPWEKYASSDMDGFLGRAMQQINRMTENERGILRSQFAKAMDAAWSIFGNDAFRKRTDPDASRNPVSKALFEAWSVTLANCTSDALARLVGRADHVREEFMVMMREDRDFEIAISYGTGARQRVEKRFGAIAELVDLFIR